MNNISIIGTGHAYPKKILTNADLSMMLDVSEDWIYSRTGVKQRYIADETEKTSDLAIASAMVALDESKLSPDEIDLIICCTITPDKLCPSISCTLQKELKATKAVCFDINSACSGFVFGLCTANQFIKSGMYKNILVVGADMLSKFTDYSNKSSSILFGDGAGAFVLQKNEESEFIDFLLSSEGEFDSIIQMPSTGTEKSDLPPYLIMNGREVFRWAIQKVSELILKILEKNEMSLDDITHFVLHQANMRITEGIAKRLKVDKERFLSNIDTYGNTSSASIPILFSESIKNNKIKKGDKILIAGFGAGLSCGISIIEKKN